MTEQEINDLIQEVSETEVYTEEPEVILPQLAWFSTNKPLF